MVEASPFMLGRGLWIRDLAKVGNFHCLEIGSD